MSTKPPSSNTPIGTPSDSDSDAKNETATPENSPLYDERDAALGNPAMGDPATERASDPLAKLLASTRSRTRGQQLASLGAMALVALGVIVLVWALFNLPFWGRHANASEPSSQEHAIVAPTIALAPTAAALLGNKDVALMTSNEPERPLSATVTPEPRAVGLTIGLPVSAPLHFLRAVGDVVLADGTTVSVSKSVRDRPVFFDWKPRDGVPVYETTFAAAERFDTIFPEISLDALKSSWAGDATTYTVISVLTTSIPAIEQILGPAGTTVTGQSTMTDVVSSTWLAAKTDDGRGLALVPFDQLVPQLVVLPVDGQNPVENANKFDPAQYPLTATLYAHDAASNNADAAKVQELIAALPAGNRDASELTTLTMTGVTAMVRMMADEMDRRGAAWPAEYVGEELSSADITHISNEVPWVDECKTDLRMDNFNFCTKTEYMETLRLSGTDIIGLTGNHQNDFGSRAAYHSLDLYEQEGWPVYGGGRTLADAMKPLFVEHNGNRLAFLGANSYGPPMAWAEENYPGSAPFNLAILSQQIREIKALNQADLVLVELQYQESYGTEPLIDQRNDFNALVRAGADIVTGVQSHVPQGMEFTNNKLILYGLGNLYFDQMFQQNTRENMIVKHTIYNGRHISTQVMTTLLYDFGQPRWMTDDERASLLNRVFRNSYWEY